MNEITLQEAYDMVLDLRAAYRKVKQAEKLKCKCEGFVLQYEGRCLCKAGHDQALARRQLQQLLDTIDQ